MADVFISYSKGKATDTVEQIADELNRAGISCWYMKRDSRYGTFADKIAQEIFSCQVFLLILDERSVQSEHVKNEVGLAFERVTEHQPITILPVRITDCALSYGLRYYLNRFTVTNAKPPDERRITELVKDIADILGKAQPTTPAAPPTVTQPEPQPAPSAKIIKRGECGNNVTYMLKNGVLTISGKGAMRDFKWDNKAKTSDAPWWNERETISLVRIQHGVAYIGWCTFKACTGLTSVVIPDSVTQIGNWAFEGCAGLTSVVIPDSVTYIGDGAFYGCEGLTSVVIPDRMTSIGECAFYGCEGLISVVIPDSMIEIGWCAFAGCKNLKSVSVPVEAAISARGAFPPTVHIKYRA